MSKPEHVMKKSWATHEHIIIKEYEQGLNKSRLIGHERGISNPCTSLVQGMNK